MFHVYQTDAEAKKAIAEIQRRVREMCEEFGVFAAVLKLGVLKGDLNRPQSLRVVGQREVMVETPRIPPDMERLAEVVKAHNKSEAR